MRKGRKPAPAVRREINERLIEEIEQMAQQLSVCALFIFFY
ncbi:unnamed protein product [Brugia pahangi]|uniref:Transposase n=1 Tax=Brugia pahangi TaxID=6280 RepID=A0A0N4TH68_BRUPA|nr:unnamed protein product [Brugia pahangi]